jgi:glutathione S-transferase
MYDLAGHDSDLRFSPYCWRIRMALAHKDLAFETIPWRFTDTDALAFAGATKVPLLVDDETAVSDSWRIAEYLEKTYPDRPSLFEGNGGRAHARFINCWADSVMVGGVVRLVVRDVWQVLHPKDQDYFRSSREAYFGETLENVVAGRDKAVLGFRESLKPLRQVLRSQEWFGGSAPTYADYILFGPLQWARCASRFELLDEEDPLWGWRERTLDLFGGLARDATIW